MQAAAERGWTVEKILLTHGHFDHMGAADALRCAWGAPVYVHYLLPMYLEDPSLNLSASHGMDITLYDTRPPKDGDRIVLDAVPDVAVTVLHTPGHTDDSVVYVLDGAGIAFVGDTVYEGGPGPTIFPTGDPFYAEPGSYNTMRLNFTNADADTIRDGIKRLADVLREAIE